MLARTHFSLGILAGITFLQLIEMPSLIHYAIYFILIHIGVLLPDIDHPKSKINKKIPPLKIMTFFFKHRGFFHSLFAPLILGAITYKYLGLFISLPLFVGYLTHLFSDALTVNGINFLHPISNFKISGPVRTGSLLEHIIFYLSLILIVLMVYYQIFSE